MSASSSLLPMMNPQPPMNVSTGLGIGVSVVIPSFSRPENIPQMLSSLLLATCMQDSTLKTTVATECTMAVERGKYGTWGRHYVRTLPMLLRAHSRCCARLHNFS